MFLTKFIIKKMKIFIIIFLILIAQISNGQSTYLGLKGDAEHGSTFELNPKIQIIDHYIYVPTSEGIYRKDLSTLNDTIWEPFAFHQVPIRDFVKNEDQILAITPYSEDSLLLLSTDNGQSFIDYTHSCFFEFESFNSLHRIAQNKQNPSSVIILQDHYGVVKSEDFGLSWVNLNAWSGGYQERFVAFHPEDSLSIYYTGEMSLFSSYTQVSYDGGMTWSLNELINNNCTHFLAFHPINQNLILSGQEGKISKSEDKGITWLMPYELSEYLYIYKIIFDQNNPNKIYATGALNHQNDEIMIYQSLDNGDSWSLALQESLDDFGGVLDMVQYEDKLILLTLKKGMYVMDIATLNTQEQEIKKSVYIYPNPSNHILYFDRLEQINNIEMVDFAGKTVKYIPVSTLNTYKMDVSDLNKGTYFIIFYTDTQILTQKIMIDE